MEIDAAIFVLLLVWFRGRGLTVRHGGPFEICRSLVGNGIAAGSGLDGD
jgi:hypothetical protein